MLNRIKVSLFKPSMIGAYAKDKVWMLLVYSLIMIAIMMIPTVISCFTFSGITKDSFEYYQSEYIKKSAEIPNAIVTDYYFTMGEEKPKIVEVGGMNIGFDIAPQNGLYIYQDGVSYVSMGIYMFTYTWAQLELENLEFHDLAVDSFEDSYQDFADIKYAINIVLDDLKPLLIVGQIVAALIVITLFYFISIALFSLIIKISTPLKYREVFTTTLYGMTMASLGYTFGELYNLYLLDVVFSFISMIFIYKAIKVLIINRIIQKKLIK